jgi:threonine 3-dehydrogenase
MAILITGGGGLTGSSLASTFLERGERVVLFSRSLTPVAGAGRDEVVRVRGDVANWHDVLNVVKDHHIEHIAHLAAMLTVPSEANPWASINTNAIGMYNVLEAARLFGVKKVVMTSSMGAYNVTADTVVTEETVQRPATIYGCCKVFAELLGLYYHNKFGIDFRGIRAPHIVGPGARAPSLGQYAPWLIEAASKGEPFEVWVPETFILPMLYVKDVVKGFVALWDAPEDRIASRMYNMGQITPAPTAKELVDEVKKHFPEARITFKPDPAAASVLETIPKTFMNDRAEKEWGWRFSYSLAAMVTDFIEELKSKEKDG